jgi:hypothetical protein
MRTPGYAVLTTVLAVAAALLGPVAPASAATITAGSAPAVSTVAPTSGSLAAADTLLRSAGALAAAPQRTAGRLSAGIVFDKNWRDPHRSRIVWRLWRGEGKDRTLVQTRSWRAGSGYTKRSTNACRRNDGWLPDGTYRPRLDANYGGNFIKGRAIYLGQKACANGTVRTALFIHTEQGDRSRQCPDRPGDQACRWEYPRINDYRSYGCIKMSPGDLRALTRLWRQHFRLGYDARVHVRVAR